MGFDRDKHNVHTNLPHAGFELGSLEPQASMQLVEPPLLVRITDRVR